MGLEAAGLIASARREGNSVPLKNLVEFGGVNPELILILHIGSARGGEAYGARVLSVQQQLWDGLIAKALLVFQVTAQEQSVHPRRPLMVPAANGERMLVFVKPEVRTRAVCWIKR